MTLLPDANDRLKAWLVDKELYPLRCLLCTNTTWDLELIAPLSVAGGAGRSIELTCRKCGYQMFFNALMLDLVDRGEASGSSASPAQS